MLNYQRVPTKSIPFRFSLGIQSTRTVLASPLVTCSTIDDMKKLQPRLSTIDALMTPTYRCSWHICIYVCLCSHPSHQKKTTPAKWWWITFISFRVLLYIYIYSFFFFLSLSLSLSISLCVPNPKRTPDPAGLFIFSSHLKALKGAGGRWARLYNGS